MGSDAVVFIIYLLILLAIGLYFSRKAAKSVDSYLLGDRNIGPYICSVYWRNSNKVGVLSAMIAGSVSHILWTTFDWQAATGIHPFLGGLIVSILGMVIGNQFGTPPSEEVLDIFEEAKGPRLLPQAIEKNISCEISPEVKAFQFLFLNKCL